MKVIHKYPLIGDGCVNLREGSEVLHVGEQNGKLCLWATVDPEAKICPLKFVAIATGHVVPPGHRHIDTVQIRNGDVWHVFQVT